MLYGLLWYYTTHTKFNPAHGTGRCVLASCTLWCPGCRHPPFEDGCWGRIEFHPFTVQWWTWLLAECCSDCLGVFGLCLSSECSTCHPHTASKVWASPVLNRVPAPQGTPCTGWPPRQIQESPWLHPPSARRSPHCSWSRWTSGTSPVILQLCQERGWFCPQYLILLQAPLDDTYCFFYIYSILVKREVTSKLTNISSSSMHTFLIISTKCPIYGLPELHI